MFLAHLCINLDSFLGRDPVTVTKSSVVHKQNVHTHFPVHLQSIRQAVANV